MPKFVNGITLTKEYASLLKNLLEDNFESNFTCINAAIIPHGHLSKTQNSIFQLIKQFDKNNFPDVIFTIATSHYSSKNIIIAHDLLLEEGFVKGHKSYAEHLKNCFNYSGIDFCEDFDVAQKEHSWRIFMNAFQIKAKHLGRELSHVSLLLGDPNTDLNQLSYHYDSIIKHSKSGPLLLISGDFTHYGKDYDYDLYHDDNGDELLEKINKHDQKAIEYILNKDFSSYKNYLKNSSFCAQKQVLALNDITLGKAHLLNYEQYRLNDFQVFNKTEDNVYTGAVIAFGARESEEGICHKIKIVNQKNRFFIHHLCDNQIHSLNFFEFSVLEFIIKNELSLNRIDIQELETKIKISNLGSKLKSFKKRLSDIGLLEHAPYFKNALIQNRKQHILNNINENKIYSKYNSNFENLPILSSDDLKLNWDELGGNKDFDSSMYVRTTSGTSGQDKLISKYPKIIQAYRNSSALYDLSDLPKGFEKVVINRKDNLNTRDDIFDYKYDEANKISFFAIEGNPYLLDDNFWEGIYNNLQALKVFSLYGDPHHIFCFYLYCIRNNLNKFKINYIHLTHSFCWSYMKKALKSYFHSEIIIELRSSELITIAKQCPFGKLHLTDDNIKFDFEAFQNSEIKKLIATTLDTDYRPLVKYYAGDLVHLIDCNCHIDSPSIEYLGRETFVLNLNNHLITLADLDKIIGTEFGIQEFRIYKLENTFSLSYKLIANSTKNRINFEESLHNSFLEKFNQSIEFLELDPISYRDGKYPIILES